VQDPTPAGAVLAAVFADGCGDLIRLSQIVSAPKASVPRLGGS